MSWSCVKVKGCNTDILFSLKSLKFLKHWWKISLIFLKIFLVRDVSIHLLSCESNSAIPKMQLRTFLKAEFFLVFCRPQKDLLHRVLQNLQNQIFACEAFSRQENDSFRFYHNYFVILVSITSRYLIPTKICCSCKLSNVRCFAID